MTEDTPNILSFSSTVINASKDTFKETMQQFLSAARVEAVFGQPVQQGERLIIPTAEVLSAAGFGVGYGGQADTPGSVAGGAGGGGRVLSRPVAVIVVSPDGVKIEPVIDVTKIALAALTAFGFMLATMAQMRRGKIE